MRKIFKKAKNRKLYIIFLVLFLLITLFMLRFGNNFLLASKISRDIFLTPLNFFKLKKSDSISLDEMETIRENELKHEIDELKRLLGIDNLLSDKVIINANVIGRNIGYFYDTLTINRGEASGVSNGMAVVASNGLIGKTANVSGNYSDVILLGSDLMNKISCKIKSGDDYSYGLLFDYDKDKNVYKVEGISNTVDISIGEYVTTTGMGDIFPSGILIGTVSSIATDHFDLAKIIEVTPAVNLNDFSVVSVLKRNVNS